MIGRDIKKKTSDLQAPYLQPRPNDSAFPMPATPCFRTRSSSKEEEAELYARSRPFASVLKGRTSQMKKKLKKDTLLSSTIITEHSPNF